MKKGKVKFYNDAKGFGFIVDNENQEEIFVHASGLNGKIIHENDQVTFDIAKGKKGPNAVNVEKVPA